MPQLHTFPDDDALGGFAAEWILQRLLSARSDRGSMVLGCPSGRSPRSTYAALSRLAAARAIDLSTLHLVMMDEFVSPAGAGWSPCPADAHYSCRRFGEVEIRQNLNASLPPDRQVPAENLHLPDPNDPAGYEEMIVRLGGIDVFILASGASDGHVAFNPPGSTAEQRTRVVRLADATRRDNLATFPDFSSLADVPAWGVTVGPGTIVRASRSAVMILSGAAKAHAFQRIVAAQGYDPEWPSTVVNLCADAIIAADHAAAGQPPETDRS
jgi:glucosamine-6-phosphate deaminase